MQAIASITDEKGQIKIPEWRPERPSISMRNLLKNCPVDPECDENWGEQGLTPAERMYAWNSFAVLAMKSGDPDAPVNAIAGTAWALPATLYRRDKSQDHPASAAQLF